MTSWLVVVNCGPVFFGMHCYSEVKEPDYYYGTCVSRGHDDIIVVAMMMMT